MFINVNDFLNFFNRLDSEQQRDVFNRYKGSIVKIINNVVDFTIVVSALKPDQCTELIFLLKEKLVSILKNAYDFIIIMKGLSPAQRRYIFNTYHFYGFFDELDVARRREIFDNFKEILVSSIDSCYSFISIVNNLKPDQCRYVFERVRQRLSSFIHNADDLYILLGHLGPEYRMAVLIALREKLASVINGFYDVMLISNILDYQQIRYALNICDFYNLFRAFTDEQRRQIFDNVKGTLVSMIDSVYDFTRLTKGLRHNQRDYVFENIKQRVSSMIHNVDEFTILLGHLKPKQRSYIITHFKEALFSVMHTKKDFSTLFKHLTTEEWDVVISLYERILPENCLAGSSGYKAPGRSKRNTMEEGCKISWEDVDEFNEEKEQLRTFSEIKINSEQFLTSLVDPSLSETKREQLLQLADKVVVTGAAKDHVSNLVKHQEKLMYLNKVGRVSGMVMYGMMAKNTVGDALQGDYEGVAINLGFIAGGQGFVKVAEKAAIKGTKLVLNGQQLLGGSLKMASPFLARGTSAFIAYDLVNQIKAYQQGNPDAVVGIVGDSVYLAIDGAEIGIEIAEGFGFLEGISSVTGPIGATIGAVVFIGTDIYLAIKQVDKIDTLIHLTKTEKFIEGLRAFVGIGPQKYIQILMEEQQSTDRLSEQGINFLKSHPSIQRIILPTISVINNCRTVMRKARIVNYGDIGTAFRQVGVSAREEKECINELVISLNNTVRLNQKRSNFHWSRIKPSVVEGRLFCVPVGDDEAIPSEGAYFCDKAMGIEYTDSRTGNITFINLGDGNDRVVGFSQGDHVVILDNGRKTYHLGEGNDTFLLNGNRITGVISGGGGTNTLDLGSFAKEQKSIRVNLVNTRSFIYFMKEAKGRLIPLKIFGINNILLRANKEDLVALLSCHARYIDARGGKNQDNPDIIFISENEHCKYVLQLIIRPYTNIYNSARNRNSQFTYSVPIVKKGEAAVSIREEGGSHRFVFAYILNDINRLEKTNNTLSFAFIEDQIDTRFIDDNNRYRIENEFMLRIELHASNELVLQLGDNTEIKVEGNNFYAFQHTNRSIDDIIKEYSRIANRLKLTIFAQALPSNERIAIGHGKHDVLPNDPYHRSHLVGNGGENIFVIRSHDKILGMHQLPLPEVILYDRDDEDLIDTLDLREISHQLQKDLGLNVQARTMLVGDDVAIVLFVFVQGVERLVSKIYLKDAVPTKWTNRLHIILNHAQMKLDAEWILKPIPLKFDGDEDLIVIGSEDVEANMVIAIAKKAGDYHFYRLGDNLLISNTLNSRITDSERYTVSLQNFYQAPKLETLSIVFEDKAITLQREMARIKNATAFKDQITQYRQAKNSLLFNKTLIHETVYPRQRREVENNASHSAISLCGAIRNNFFKLALPQIEKGSNNIPLLKVFNPAQFDGSGLLLLIANLTGCKLAPLPTEENNPRFYSEDFVLKALQKKF